MAASPGYILLDQGELPVTDSAGRVLGDASHVRNHLSTKRGISTVVVPPSTPGGTPEGFDPHMIADTVINFDPGTARAVSYTVAQLQQQQRHQFAPGVVKTANPVVMGNVVAAAPLLNNEYTYEAEYAAEPVAVQPRAISGLRPMEVLQNAVRRQVDQVAIQPKMSAPQKLDTIVTFEVTGIGVFQAPYSDVILQGGMIVLVFDHAVTGKMCYFPNFTSADSSQSPPAVALRVEGASSVHLIETTGIQFKYGTLEFCVLLIAQTALDD